MADGPTGILITGASSGLGRALALCYAGPGVTLVLHGRSRERLEKVAEPCIAAGAAVQLLVHDLTDVAGWRSALAQACGTITIDLALVNAGTAATTSGELESWQTIDAVLTVNLMAAIATVSVLAEPMRARGGGQIVLVSSLAAWVGMPLAPAYGASKAGLKCYGEALRGLMAPHGVGVTVVLPGFVDTAMSRNFPGAKPWMLSPDRAAQHIRASLARDPARISFPWPLALGMWALACMPPSWAQFILLRLGYARARRAGPTATGN